VENQLTDKTTEAQHWLNEAGSLHADLAKEYEDHDATAERLGLSEAALARKCAEIEDMGRHASDKIEAITAQVNAMIANEQAGALREGLQ
jgi:ParB-like chromosome segregation protein Spo0J